MSPFGNTVQLTHPDGDYLEIQFTDSPAACGAHIYRINQAPNITTPPDGFSGFNNCCGIIRDCVKNPLE